VHLVDHILIFILFAFQPVYGYFEGRRYEARAKAGELVDRVVFYRQTMWVEWAFLAVLCASWFMLRRPPEDLGFVTPGGPGFWIGLVLLTAATGFLLYSWRSAKNATAAEKSKQSKYVQEVAHYLPQSALELQSFYRVSVTAGIVEEIVYRGFVLWYLALLMPMWAAVVVSSLAFGVGHIYQGVNGATRAGLVGLAFAIFYVVTGSIWLPIIAQASWRTGARARTIIQLMCDYCTEVITEERFKRCWMMHNFLARTALALVLCATAVATVADDDLGAIETIELETRLGTITIELYVDRAPLSAASFLDYLDKGLMDEAVFYRVVTHENDNGSPLISVVQGGLLDETKMLPPIAHETTAATGLSHVDGAVSIARAEPGTGSAGAFFICVGDNPSLDFGGMRNPDQQGFAVFGQVVEGMDVVRAIQQLPADQPTDNEYLKGQLLGEPVKILSARRATK
jgi:peptidyl-prolyl cis-trans isomerase A (cyclophilin A)